MSTKSQLIHKKIYLGESLTGDPYNGSFVNSKWNPFVRDKLFPIHDFKLTSRPTDFKTKAMLYAHYGNWVFGDLNSDIKELTSGEVYTGANVEGGAVFYPNTGKILVGTNQNKIITFDPENEEFSSQEYTISGYIEEMVYNDIDDKVYVATQHKVYVIDGDAIFDGILYSNNNSLSIRGIIAYKNWIVIRTYSYDTGKSSILFWDRDTSNNTWDKEFIFNTYILQFNVINNDLYILERYKKIYQSDSNMNYLIHMKKYIGNGFSQPISTYRVNDDVTYATAFRKIANGFIGIKVTEYFNPTTETTKKSGLIIFVTDGYIYENTGFLDTDGTLDGLIVSNINNTGNGLPKFDIVTYEINSNPTRQYYNVSFDTTFNKPSSYTTKFYGDNYNIFELSELYLTYTRLLDNQKIKIYYRLSDEDEFTFLKEINNSNKSSSDIQKEELFRKKIKDLATGKIFQRIQFRIESTGGAKILSAGIWLKQINYE